MKAGFKRWIYFAVWGYKFGFFKGVQRIIWRQQVNAVIWVGSAKLHNRLNISTPNHLFLRLRGPARSKSSKHS